MSLATTQSLSTDVATAVNTNVHSYVSRFADSGKSQFSQQGLTLPVERILSVSHETTKAGNQRHLVRLDRTEIDSLLVPATLGVYVVIDRPPSQAFTNTIILNEINKLVDFLIDGGMANSTAVLNNEV